MNKINIVKKVLGVLILLIISFLLGTTTNSIVENIGIQSDISSFKKKGVYQSDISNSTEKFYKVPRETWMIDKPTYLVVDGRMYYGNSGDIVTTPRSNVHFPEFIKDLVSFYCGGHSTFVCYPYIADGINLDATYSIESSSKSEVVMTVKNDFWNDENYRDEVIVYRPKCSEKIKQKAFMKMVGNLGKKYNENFTYKKNQYYCSDLISRAFEPYGVDLNYDGFYTSILDLMYSKETYISFYKKFKDGINYYYYIG